MDSRGIDRQKKFSFPIVLLCTYVFIEYARPDFLLGFHPGEIILLLLFIPLVKNVNKVKTVIKDRFYILFGILLLEMIVHGPIAVNNYWAYQSFLSMLSIFIYSLSIVVFIDSIGKMRIFLTCLIIVHLLAASRYFPVDLNMGYSGIIGETNDFAMAMNIVIPISIFMGVTSKGIKRIAFFVATIIFIYANISTVSRGGFLGMVTMALMGIVFSKSRVKVIFLFAISIVIFISLIPSYYKKQIDSISTEFSNSVDWLQSKEVTTPIDPDDPKSGTGIDRVELWKVGLRVFTDNPILGVGQGNLPWVIQRYQDYDKDIWGRGIGGRAVHSLYVSVLAELGIVGTTLFLLMLVDFVSKYRRIMRAIAVKLDDCGQDDQSSLLFLEYGTKGFIASVTGFLVSAIFLSVFGYPQFWHLGGLIVSMYFIATRMQLFSNNAVPGEASS
jgi:O-antigen ligase